MEDTVEGRNPKANHLECMKAGRISSINSMRESNSNARKVTKKVTQCSWSFIHESVSISLVFLHNILSISFELMTDEPEESQRYLPDLSRWLESMRSVKFESGFDRDSYWNLQYFPTIMIQWKNGPLQNDCGSFLGAATYNKLVN